MWIKIKEFFIKVKTFFIKKLYVFFIISLFINVFLLLFGLKINVSMAQSQTQQLTSTVYNVNNNQNININFAMSYISQYSPMYTNEKINNLTEQLNRLNLYQQQFLKIWGDYIYYPLMTVVTTNNVFSQSNYSANFNNNQNFISTWLDFIKK
jgi:hypothetical protein